MNIWLLTSEFPPAYGGGISTYNLETAQMFSSFGHNVTVLTQNPKANQLVTKRVNSYTIIEFNPNNYDTYSFLGYEANLSYAFAQVVKELADKQGAPDIIECQEYMGIAYYLLQYKWLKYPLYKDLKIAITLHAPSFLYWEYNEVPLYQLPYFWIGEMERFCIRSADLVISPSQYLINELKSRVKIDDIIIHVLKNPLKINEQNFVKEFTKNKLIFFGKLTPQKGCLELLQYFKQLWRDGFEHSLTMIGGGDHLYHPEGMDMVDFIKKTYRAEIQTGKLILLGAIPPEKLQQHVSDAHIIIIPSIVDNLPYTVPEVMAMGKIVLASKQGGQSEIIENNIDGFLFDHKNPSSFKAQLEFILSLPDSSLKEIGLKAIFTVQKEFAYTHIYKQKIELFNNAISGGTASMRFPFIRPNKNVVPALKEEESTNDLLSIIVPYYNMSKYVEETITSVLRSSYKSKEIIVVNDGSTGPEDITILEGLAEKYGVNVIHKQNEGLALARNTGAKAAKGQFIAFIDPDDTIEPDYYAKAISVLNSYSNVYFVGCWARYFGKSTDYWPTFNPEPPYMLVHNMINSSALVYKKQAFLHSGLNDARMIYGMEDYESVINLVGNGYSGVALPEALWNYRIRKNSMARSFNTTKQVYLYRLIAEKHKTFYSTFGTEITNLLNANGPGFTYDNPTLFYNLPGSSLINKRIKRLILRAMKSNPVLRKMIIKIKKLL